MASKYRFLRNGQITIVVGLPRSGKSLFATKVAYINQDNFDCIVCTPDISIKPEFFRIPVYTMTVPEMMEYRFRNTLLVIDEASLNGLDSRDAMQNFKNQTGKRWLATCKTLGHGHNSMIMTNHGMTDTDSKVRNSLSGQTYRARGTFFIFWCIIQKLTLSWEFVPEQGTYVPVVDNPGLLQALLSGDFRLVRKKKWGKMYDSFTVSPILAALPEFDAAGASRASNPAGCS